MGVRVAVGCEWGSVTSLADTFAPVASRSGTGTLAGTTDSSIKKTGGFSFKFDFSADAVGTATGSTAITMTDSGAAWTVNAFAGFVVTMGGSTATIVSNTATELAFTAWAPTGPTTGAYSIAASGRRAQWKPGVTNSAEGLAQRRDGTAGFSTACVLAYLYVPNYPRNASGMINVFQFTVGAGVLRKLSWYNNGGVTTLRGTNGTTVQGTSGTLTPGTWIAVKWLVSTGTDSTPQQDTLWIDNLRPDAYVFKGAGSSSISNGELQLGDTAITGGNCVFYLDDLMVMDEGPYDGDGVKFANVSQSLWSYGRFPAQVPRSYPFFPITGTPTYDAWLKSTGTTAWDLIDESDVQTTTDYIHLAASTAANTKQSWLMQTVTTVGVPAGQRPIFVGPAWYASEPTSGSSYIAFGLILGGVDYTAHTYTPLAGVQAYRWWHGVSMRGSWYKGAHTEILTRALIDQAWEVMVYNPTATAAGETVQISRFLAEIWFIDPLLEDLAWGS